jgi:hypothetical protein
MFFMQNEISSGTMLGIVLIALAAVIGLGFGVFSIAKGVSNEGVVNVQDNLGTVSQSAYDDFDNKIVTGTQVKAAYKQFQGKPVAILINTQALNNGVKNYPSHKAYVHKTMPGDVAYINYNAVLATDSGGSTEPAFLASALGGTALGSTGTTTTISVDTTNTGLIKSAFGFYINSSNGKIVYDSNIGGFDTAGCSEFISTSAKYTANLVKDSSQAIIGIAFTQLKR